MSLCVRAAAALFASASGVRPGGVLRVQIGAVLREETDHGRVVAGGRGVERAVSPFQSVALTSAPSSTATWAVSSA